MIPTASSAKERSSQRTGTPASLSHSVFQANAFLWWTLAGNAASKAKNAGKCCSQVSSPCLKVEYGRDRMMFRYQQTVQHEKLRSANLEKQHSKAVNLC